MNIIAGNGSSLSRTNPRGQHAYLDLSEVTKAGLEFGLFARPKDTKRKIIMVVDNEDIQKIEISLRKANQELQTLVQPMALAKTVIDLHSNEQRQALAKQQRRYIERGEGSANSAALALSDPLYREEFKRLRQGLEAAYQVAYQWDALKERIGSARSVLARMRETLNL